MTRVLLKVSELKKTAPGEKGDGVKADSSSENETKLKEETPSSSSCSAPEELQGFTSASEVYSVSSTLNSHFTQRILWIIIVV